MIHPFSHLKTLTVALCALTLLSGCQTLDTTLDRIDKLANEPPVSANNDQQLLNFNSQCPKIKLVDELSVMSEFIDLEDPKDKERFSSAEIKEIQSACEYKNGSVVVDLRMTFEGELGPLGRQKPSDTPFFSYPFFVAVNGVNEQIMAKEVFAASMTFGAGENTHLYFENLRQVIPLKNRRNGPRHSIYVGFQLTPEQLEYNRTQAEQERRALKTAQERAAQEAEKAAAASPAEAAAIPTALSFPSSP